MVLKELLETGHGHAVGGVGGFLTTWGRKSRGLLGNGSLGRLFTLGGNLLIGDLEDLLDGLSNIALFGGGLLGLGSSLGGSLGSGTTLNTDSTHGGSLLSARLALSISNILDRQSSGGTLEVETITLAS